MAAERRPTARDDDVATRDRRNDSNLTFSHHLVSWRARGLAWPGLALSLRRMASRGAGAGWLAGWPAEHARCAACPVKRCGGNSPSSLTPKGRWRRLPVARIQDVAATYYRESAMPTIGGHHPSPLESHERGRHGCPSQRPPSLSGPPHASRSRRRVDVLRGRPRPRACVHARIELRGTAVRKNMLLHEDSVLRSRASHPAGRTHAVGMWPVLERLPRPCVAEQADMPHHDRTASFGLLVERLRVSRAARDYYQAAPPPLLSGPGTAGTCDWLDGPCKPHVQTTARRASLAWPNVIRRRGAIGSGKGSQQMLCSVCVYTRSPSKTCPPAAPAT